MTSAGRVMPLPKGTYSGSATYNVLDIVEYNGSSYIAKQATTGNAPTNTTYWQLLVSSGSLDSLSDVSVSSEADGDLLIYDGDDNEWKNDHTTTSTLTGNPVSLTTDSAQVARSTKITLSPIQAGSGDPSPSNPRAISGYDKVEVAVPRKNLIKGWASIGNYNGSTGEKETQSPWDYVTTEIMPLTSGETYCISNSEVFSSLDIACFLANGTFLQKQSIVSGQNVTSASFTVPNNTERVAIIARIDGHGWFSDVSVAGTPQLELGSTATTYEPYNPITDITDSLPNTIYGGELDVESGVLKVTHGLLRIDDASLTWHYSVNNGTFFYINFSRKALKKGVTIFSCFKYADVNVADMPNNSFKDVEGQDTVYVKATDYSDVNSFKTALGSQTFAYELATPYTIQLTPHQMLLLKGANTVFSNGTSIEIVYRDGRIATLEDLESSQKSVEKAGEVIDDISDVMTINGSKNLLCNTAASKTENGVTFTINSDKTVSLNGTATAATYLAVSSQTYKAGKYKVSGCPVGGGAYRLVVHNSDNSITVRETGYGAEFTLTAATQLETLIYLDSGASVTGKVFKPMITLASQPDSDYNHYVIYAMTNRSLTEKVTSLQSNMTGILKYTGVYYKQLQYDGVKTISQMLDALHADLIAHLATKGSNYRFRFKMVRPSNGLFATLPPNGWQYNDKNWNYTGEFSLFYVAANMIQGCEFASSGSTAKVYNVSSSTYSDRSSNVESSSLIADYEIEEYIVL